MIDILFFVLLFSFMACVIIILLSNSNRPYLNTGKNIILGIISLILSNMIGGIGINFFTTAVSAILGFSGVLLLVLLNIM